MTQAGFLERKPVRPGSAAAVILVHGAAIAGLMLAASPEIIRHAMDPTRVRLIPVEPDPPPIPERPPEPRVQPQQRSVIDTPPPLNDLHPPEGARTSDPPAPPPDPGSLAGRDDVPRLPPQPPADPVRQLPPPVPVRVEAQMTGGYLQPPDPTSEQRLEHEGIVVIRVTVGTDGRVIGTQQVRATSSAFYEVTERHARARWRFRPATVDGRPVESHKTVTVRFTLDG
jgi:protein TonB